MEPKKYIYLIGTAGSGKSTLCKALGSWLQNEGADVLHLNLDPGADSLPYVPDIDVREWVDLYDIMQRYNLGPNGAQIASADNIALVAGEIHQRLDEDAADYVLLDTPGQIELFAFRKSSRVLMEQFDSENSQLVFLVDPFLSSSPSGFISQQLLYITCRLRMPLPSMTVLSKSDMIEDERVERIIEWSRNPEALYSDALDEAFTLGGQFNMEVLRSIRDMDLTDRLYRCSAKTGEGLPDIYNIVQQVYAGGDDIMDGFGGDDSDEHDDDGDGSGGTR